MVRKRSQEYWLRRLRRGMRMDAGLTFSKTAADAGEYVREVDRERDDSSHEIPFTTSKETSNKHYYQLRGTYALKPTRTPYLQ